MRRIFVTREIPDAGLALLRRRRGLDIKIFHKDRAIKPRELKKYGRGAEVLLSLLTDKIDGPMMDALGPQLKMIANYAVGFDNVDLKAAKERGIIVSNTPGMEISEAVAEHVIAMMFALAHRIIETDAFTRHGKYHGWGPKMLLGQDIYGKTLGIVGAGAIGTAVARRMRDGFDVKILYTDVQRNEKIEQQAGAKFLSLKQLLSRSDFVSLHVPLLPATHHLISGPELRLMKKSAFLINTARGPVIDERALITALHQGEIAGAGLDVYECEPFIACSPYQTKELRKMRNVILTPHTASATHGARDAMSRVGAQNILAYLSGKQPPNAIA